MYARCEENEYIARCRRVGLSHRQPDNAEQSEHSSSQWRLLQRTMQQELNLVQFTTGLMAKPSTRPAEVMWRERLNLTVLCFLFHNTAKFLGLNPAPQILPALLIERKSVPVVFPAAVIQSSIPAFSQSGTEIVRMWTPLPTRSACRCSRDIRYQVTTVLLKASLGSEQYHSMNSLIACS